MSVVSENRTVFSLAFVKEKHIESESQRKLLPSLVSSMELPKGSAMDSRSGSMREVSGDFRPSISFSVSQPVKTANVRQNKHKCRRAETGRKAKGQWRI